MEEKEIENKKETESIKLIGNRKNEIKDKIFNWFKSPYNFLLFLILVFAFIIRLYFFLRVGNQPLWWDEAAYGSLAKNMIYHTWDGTFGIIRETQIRPLLFPLIWSVLIRIGIPEIGQRLILEFLPSIFSVFLIYLIGKELYNKRVGLIASFIFSVIWIHLFYGLRFLVHVPSLFFVFLSVYYFIKTTKNDFNFKYFSISLISLSIATLMRYPKGLMFFVYLLYLLIDKRIALVKKAKFWISGIIGILPIILFFVYNFFSTGNIFPALLGGNYLSVPGSNKESIPFAFNLLDYIPAYLTTTFFIFFILGMIIVLFDLFIGYNLIFKNKKLKNHIFLILILVIFYSFFIFYLRSAENRYFFATTLPLCFFSAISIDFLYNFAKKYNKYLGILLVLIILFTGAFFQLSFAKTLIDQKKDSFLQVRQGFEWLKQSTPQDSIILTHGGTVYAMYYAERRYEIFHENATDMNLYNSTYAVLHAFNPPTDVQNKYMQDNQNIWKPIGAYFFDIQQTQPALVIYQKQI